jgi:hypothetical protein
MHVLLPVTTLELASELLCVFVSRQLFMMNPELIKLFGIITAFRTLMSPLLHKL